LDFTAYMRRLCTDMCTRLPALRHIDMRQIAIGFRQTRKAVLHGLQASLTPLRFAGGRLYMVRGGRCWTIERLLDPDGHEYLYLLNFYLPRFLDQCLHEKLATVVHELWHVSPECNGDLRRHQGRCYAHGSSRQQYDEWSHHLARQWLQRDPPVELFPVLRSNFAELIRLHGAVYGLQLRSPRLLPVGGRCTSLGRPDWPGGAS
jgi:hypothetical protein